MGFAQPRPQNCGPHVPLLDIFLTLVLPMICMEHQVGKNMNNEMATAMIWGDRFFLAAMQDITLSQFGRFPT